MKKEILLKFDVEEYEVLFNAALFCYHFTLEMERVKSPLNFEGEDFSNFQKFLKHVVYNLSYFSDFQDYPNICSEDIDKAYSTSFSNVEVSDIEEEVESLINLAKEKLRE